MLLSLDEFPKDWKNKEVGDVIKFEGGSQPAKKYFEYKSTENNIRLIQTRDYKTNKYRTYIPEEKAKKFCNKEDIIIGRYGPPLFQIFRGLEGAYNVALIKAVPNENLIYKEYCYYFLSQKDIQNYLESLSQRSGGQTGIEMDRLNKIPFPLPSKEEQISIVEILSTWDHEISKTEKLIQAKKRYKKGLMQRLLSPSTSGQASKIRFPKFEGEDWVEVKLGEIFTERNDKGYDNLKLVAITTNNGVIDRDKLDRRDTSSDNKSNYKRILPGDIGYNTMRMWQGVSGYSELKGIVSPAYTIVNPIKDKADGLFMSYLFKHPPVVDLFRRFSQGLVSDTLNLKYSNFAQIKLKIPSSIEEQQKIASVFTEIDNEIDLMKKKVALYQKQKKGLMQQLLTGKIRVK